MDQTLTKEKLRELRALAGETIAFAILLQDDPDPDAIASAIALRTLLGRNKLTTPIFSFTDDHPARKSQRWCTCSRSRSRRPTPRRSRASNEIAMVDVQPPYFNGRLPRADIVIDHHPGYTTGNAPFEDVRIRYGATATILTEYLISAEERVSERLATALLYGIKSDTLMLSRRVTDDDLQAFTFLYPLANYNLLRRIERPELPCQLRHESWRARWSGWTVQDDLAVVHLGPVKRDDLIVQMADFCLQFEGAEWVAVSGKLGDNLVIAVRNHGDGRAAPAMSCASCSAISAAPAAIATWPRR